MKLDFPKDLPPHQNAPYVNPMINDKIAIKHDSKAISLSPWCGGLYWTQHSLKKLRQYNLSVSRIKRILRFPKRKEIGIAPDTIASMQPTGSKKRPYEIWVMYQQKSKVKSQKSKVNPKITIISAWRYPGISPIHEPPPIPEEVWEILAKH